jgi:hypothetical protein
MTTEGINKYGFLKMTCLVIDWVSVSEWLLLTPREQLFSYIMVRTSYLLMRWWWCQLCTRTKHSKQIHMSLHLDTLSWFRANQFLLLHVLSRVATNTNFIVWGLTQSGWLIQRSITFDLSMLNIILQRQLFIDWQNKTFIVGYWET